MKLTTKHLRVILLAAVALAGAVYVFVNRRKSSTQVVVAADVPFNPKSWAWCNEEHWIVDQTMRDVAEMLVITAGKSPTKLQVEIQPNGPQAYSVSLRGADFGPRVGVPVLIRTYPWDPEAYSDLSRSLIAALDIKPDSFQAGPRDLFHRLLHPRPSEIDSLQSELSAALNQHPRSAELHEQAALTLSTLGLFNSVGTFRDHRFLLCRIAAHLTIARSLRPESSPAGRLASLAVLSLTGQTQEVVQEIKDARRVEAIPSAWLDTIYMLTTGDWRVVKDATKVSLGEALASYNGRNLHLGSEPAYRWIQGADIDACRGTVNRMAMRYDYSVEMGHEVNNGLLDWDLGELQSILLSRHGGRRLAKGELVESLNALPTRAFNEGKNAIEVIGWGIWARLF